MKLAIAAVPPETRQCCASKRPRTSWLDHDAARAELAEAIAVEAERHFVLAEQPIGRKLAATLTNRAALLSGASGTP
jgi:hypothetical protein